MMEIKLMAHPYASVQPKGKEWADTIATTIVSDNHTNNNIINKQNTRQTILP